MKITLSIDDTNDLTFEELKDAISGSLEDNGLDISDSNLDIEETPEGDPNELEDKPDEAEDAANQPKPPAEVEQPKVTTTNTMRSGV